MRVEKSYDVASTSMSAGPYSESSREASHMNSQANSRVNSARLARSPPTGRVTSPTLPPPSTHPHAAPLAERGRGRSRNDVADLEGRASQIMLATS
jgi:hypothetical protein